MKQKPVKKMKLPKYAAALALLTVSAGMLNGCGVQTDGTAPMPSEEYSEPQLAGDVAIEQMPDAGEEVSS